MVENIEADQTYFLSEVNQVKRKILGKNLANIAPFSSIEDGYTDQTDVSFVRLLPIHSFMWERDISKTISIVKDLIPQTGRNISMIIMSEKDTWNKDYGLFGRK